MDIFNIEARRPFRPERRGFYTPAEWTKINGITAIIVDPHPEVLPLWCKINNPPAILVHIDDHADMSPGAPTLEQAKREYAYANIKSISDYAKNCVSVDAFISFAIHEGIVGGVFWYDPRNDFVTAFGRVQEGEIKVAPTTKINERGRIEWDSINRRPASDRISIEDAQSDLRQFNGPIILDIDLDSILCITDPVGQNPNTMYERLDRVRSFIELLGIKPEIISIARSQTPSLWTPPESVDKIQMEIIHILREVFSK